MQELVIYVFEKGHNAVEVFKNVCCGKGEDVVDQNTVTRWIKKFHLCFNNVDDQGGQGGLKL